MRDEGEDRPFAAAPPPGLGGGFILGWSSGHLELSRINLLLRTTVWAMGF